MPARRLWVPAEVASAIRTLHPDIKKKIKAGIKDILDDPECGKPLKDELEGLRSLRVGRLRIIYRGKSKGPIEIIAVGPRKSIYEETYRLLRN